LSWKEKILNLAGANPGPLSTALVYAAGGRFYTRWLYEAQGRLTGEGPSACGRLTLSFDVDYPEDVESLPALCDRLASAGITAAFAVIGMLVRRFPVEHRRLVEAGHEVLNHTYSHPDNELLHPNETFDQLTPQARLAQIEDCRKACEDVLGISPEGFRAPHFGKVTGRDFYGILRDTGCRFSSSVIAPGTRTFGLPFRTAEGIVEFPVSCCPVHPFAVLDTWHSLRTPGGRHASPGRFSSLCREALALAADSRGYLNLYFDPRHVSRHPEAGKAVELLAPARHGLRLATYRDHLAQIEPVG